MRLTSGQLEEIASWCEGAMELESERRRAWRTFFADDDPRPVRYWPGSGDMSRHRRFLGWFMFDHKLASGEHPAVRAIGALYRDAAAQQALEAVAGSRFVLAVVASVLPGRQFSLEVQVEQFIVRNRQLSRQLTPQAWFAAHLVPAGRHGEWLVGPGWLELPIRLGPGMRRNLLQLQMDPLMVERLLQSRGAEDELSRPGPPMDESLAEAVSRMSAAAREAGLPRLVMSARSWTALVLRYQPSSNASAFSKEIVDRIGEEVTEVDALNRWLELGMNIWNATPQPDRGGKSAYQLARERTDRTRS